MLGRFRGLNNVSIKWKMAIITSFSCAIALILAFELFVVYDLTIFQKQLGTDIASVARLVGKNSIPTLQAKDAQTATTALSALRERKEIVAAGLYDGSGRLMSRYVRGDIYAAELPASPVGKGTSFEDGLLKTYETVRDNGKTLGYVYICSDTSAWSRRLAEYASVLIAILLGAVVLSFGVAWLLQRTISNPVVSLAHTMRRISTQKNYSLRAEKPSNDEIGALVDGFNKMLTEIQSRDAALQMANDELEKRVQERTSELEQEVAERKRAQDEINARNKQLLTLHQISQMDLSGDGFKLGLQQIVEEISGATGFPLVVIELFDSRKTKVTFRVGTSMKKQIAALFEEVPAERSLSGIVVRSGSPLVDIAKEGGEPTNRQLASSGLRSFICMPMAGGEGIIGTLSLAHPKSMQADGRLLRWVESLASYLASLLERQRSHERLRESEEKTRKIIETALDAVVSIDSDGVITGWNGQAEKIFGWSAEEAIGQLLEDTIIPANFVEAHRQGLKRFVETGEGTVLNRRIELSAKTKSGVEFPVELAISPIRSGDAFAFTAFIRDITARKRYESELAKARDVALEGAKLKSEFLANMSHEIRTPMNGVIGMSDLLLDTTLTDEQRDYANTIRNSAEALLTVINDILDFSKIEAGKMTIDFTEVALRELLEETADLLAPQAQEKGVELYCSVSSAVPVTVKADPVRIRQIITNLVGNAIKFTESGEVLLSCDVVTTSEKHTKVRLSVRDTGIGIPPDRLAAVFESFTQVDGSTTRRFGGTGLGLAITRQLVDLMGGTIGVDSEVGKGSRFWVELDLERMNDQPPKDGAELRGARVLIVDDSDTNRRIVKEFLQSWQCEVHEASTGLEVFQLIDSGANYSAAIVDGQLPDMQGSAIASRLVESGCRCIVLSPIRDQSGRDSASSVREIVRLTKPIRRAALLQALLEVAGLRSTPVEHSGTRDSDSQNERGGLRILLAEDNPINRKVATNLLAKMGHEVICAENGLQAVGFVRATDFDMAFMDVQMPEMDGLEATAAIRQLERDTGTRMPIIAMTAHVMKGDRERCLAAGMDDYVSKPITPDKVQKVLRRWSPVVPTNGRDNHTGLHEEYLDEVVGNDEEFRAEVIEQYTASAAAYSMRLRGALSQDDRELLVSELQALKSSSTSVGAIGVAQKCDWAEEKVRAGIHEAEVIDSVISELESTVHTLRGRLKEAA